MGAGGDLCSLCTVGTWADKGVGRHAGPKLLPRVSGGPFRVLCAPATEAQSRGSRAVWWAGPGLLVDDAWAFLLDDGERFLAFFFNTSDGEWGQDLGAGSVLCMEAEALGVTCSDSLEAGGWTPSGEP